MTDQELIAWLRDLAETLGKEAFTRAADRIEELVKELQNTEDRANAFATKEYYTEMRAERAEAKLAKAVEALHFYGDDPYDIGPARTVLAELEGKE